MNFDIGGNPEFGDLEIELAPGETFWAESGAMSRMSGDLSVSSRLLGGFVPAAVRKVLGGESLFVAEYKAGGGGGKVACSPKLPGTVLHRRLDGDSFYLTGGSFLACSPGVQLETRFGGLKAFFSKEGAFFIECKGHGDVFYNSYGAVVEREVSGSLIVDNGHLVAWEPSLDYEITSVGGVKQTLFSGEGLVMRFSGQGKLLLQSRHLGGMVNWLLPYCK